MPTGCGLCKTIFCCIPQRYILCFMGFLGLFNAYTMRICLNIAITEMVPAVNHSEFPDPHGCIREGGSQHSDKVVVSDEKYNWDSETQGLILSAFFWGYVITQIPGGVLADIFGGKYTLSLGILSTAVLTLLTPAVIYMSEGNWLVLFLLRLVEGLGEGTTYPALNALLGQWIPLHERAKMGTVVFSGAQIGTVVSSAVSGFLIQATKRWSSVFYFFGAVALLWFIIFTIICYSTPAQNPFISEKEKTYLETELHNVATVDIPVPCYAIITSVPVWALITAQFGHDWGFFTMVTDLPTYYKDVLKFNIAENGIWNSAPYIFMTTASMLFAILSDWLIKKKYLSVTFSRKFFTTTGSAGPAIFMVLLSYAGCDRVLAVAMFTCGVVVMGTYYCGMKVNGLDLSPNFAGTLMGMVNGIGAIAGMMAPYVAGVLTKNHTMLEWRLVYWISFAVFMVTNVIYVIFASGEEQSWNRARSSENL